MLVAKPNDLLYEMSKSVVIVTLIYCSSFLEATPIMDMHINDI